MASAVEKLEREFAAGLGVEGAVVTGFGRGALMLALQAIPGAEKPLSVPMPSVGKNDAPEILVPNFICAQVPEAARRAGGRPVFFPVSRDLSVNVENFAAAFTPRTRAAVVVHYYGRVLPNIEQLAAICLERGVPLIEDCALALGASRQGRCAGNFGDAAVFSFTKSDWCYGGGVVATSSREWLARMRSLRDTRFRPAAALAFCYGVLSRLDFAANCPSRSRVAESAGRWLERTFQSVGAMPGEGDFYEAGRFDALMPGFAARRAREMLGLPCASRQQGAVMTELGQKLPMGLLVRPTEDPGDAATFLLLQATEGKAHEWMERAAQRHVTLRRCWPAYQAMGEGQATLDLRWLAEHLLILELHPDLAADEVAHIAGVLRDLTRG